MAALLSSENFGVYYHRCLDLATDVASHHPFLAIAGTLVGLLLLCKTLSAINSRWRISPIEGRYVLVTGCGRGFGRDITKRLDALGCYVFAACRSDRGMAELDKETSDRCEVIKMDISNPQEVRSAFTKIRAKIPAGKGLWGVVNNAGIGGSINGPTDWLTIDQYREIVEVNLLGTIDVTMTFLPLIKQAKGRVINVSSTYGKINLPFATQYGVSKFGIEGFSDGLRRDMRKFQCKVIVVLPGLVSTDLNSGDVVRSAVTQAWNNLPQETRDQYGNDYLEKYIACILQASSYTFGNTVSMMAEAMEQALFCKCPKTRYMVGNDNQYLYKYLTYLPDTWVDWILEKLTGVPLPAAVK